MTNMLSKCRLFEKAVKLREINSFIFCIDGELGWSNSQFVVKDRKLFEDYFGNFLFSSRYYFKEVQVQKEPLEFFSHILL